MLSLLLAEQHESSPLVLCILYFWEYIWRSDELKLNNKLICFMFYTLKRKKIIFFLLASLPADQFNLMSIQLKLRFTAFSLSHDFYLFLNIINFMRIKSLVSNMCIFMFSNHFYKRHVQLLNLFSCNIRKYDT